MPYRIYNRNRNIVVLDVMGEKSRQTKTYESLDGTVVERIIEERYPAVVDHIQLEGNAKNGDPNFVEIDDDTYQRIKTQPSFLEATKKMIRVEKVAKE